MISFDYDYVTYALDDQGGIYRDAYDDDLPSSFQRDLLHGSPDAEAAPFSPVASLMKGVQPAGGRLDVNLAKPPSLDAPVRTLGRRVRPRPSSPVPRKEVFP